MYAALFLLYVVVEVAALIWVGSMIGAVWTVCLLLAGTALGVVLVSSQWRRVMLGLRRAGQGEGSPGAAMADGALVGIGSVLMFVPGLVTSVLGLALLIPPTRWLLRPAMMFVVGRRTTAAFAGAEAFIRAGRFRSGDVIEGEVVDEHYDERPTPGRTVLP
ncbi:MAG: FxsA family protein [Rhodococcus sp.]|nr:FxsA family protein [Rhodococcus sp. (in: high G+C Gram-positive bacteria)]